MTATVTPTLLIALHPELTGRNDLQAFIDEATEEVNLTAWGTARGNTGIHYLSMHLITLAARAQLAAAAGAAGSAAAAAAGGGEIRGSIKWEAVGPLQKGYSDPRGQMKTQNSSDAWYNSTSWGQRYFQMRELIFASRIL